MNITEIKTSLSREETETYFLNEESYKNMVLAWKEFCHSNQSVQSSFYLVYALIRGEDISKVFTPITNKNKLANGQTEFQGYNRAVLRTWTPSNSASVFFGQFVDWDRFFSEVIRGRLRKGTPGIG
jgi:hypothetical protein